jgi:hypothetical protein
MMRTLAVLALSGAVALGLAACGERPQVVNYKQGSYQGKPDTPPYAGDAFKNNKDEWERTIRSRNQAQNEYKRIGS